MIVNVVINIVFKPDVFFFFLIKWIKLKVNNQQLTTDAI